MDLIDVALQAAHAAGRSIMHDYRTGVRQLDKDDGSELTEADMRADRIIVGLLAATGIPVVSEEGDDLALGLDRCWILDHLDGNKELLAKTDEFSVNIALVEDGCPVLGVVFAPAVDDLFWGASGRGAQRIRSHATHDLLPRTRTPLRRMAAARFSHNPTAERFAELNRITDLVTVGAALKYGYLAAGEVEVFPRFVGSREWDTAAGQAVLEAVGGQVIDLATREPLRYGKPDRRNPHLIALRSPYTLDDFDLPAS